MLPRWTRRMLTGLVITGLSASIAVAQTSVTDVAPSAVERIPHASSSWAAVMVHADGQSRPVYGLADGTLSMGASIDGMEALYRPAEAQIFEREAGNTEFAVVEPAVRRPMYLDRENLRYLDVRVTAAADETWQGETVERLHLEGRHSMTPASLSGVVVVTSDGIVVEADLSGTYEPEGQDEWADWSVFYRLTDLQRGVEHDPVRFNWPETVAYINAPG